jgi:polar amino acid transport system substrate-binding protein
MKRLEQFFLLLIPVVFIILSVFVMLAIGGSGPIVSAQSATPAPVVAGPTPTPDNSLARIQEAGKLVVGTSLPYEPFEFFTGFFRLDGFDIALMKEIGQRMGVEVEFKDYAFEGLFGALSLNKLDVAIAAITATPARAKSVDFSISYYQGAGAAITAEDSTITSITGATDLVGKRIGVERGTVYETWLRQAFVRTGLGSSADIYAYKSLDGAVRDLKAARLDIVLMDLPVAENYVREGGVRLVALTEPTQDFVIALPKGATSLKTQIDLILEQMNQDGTLARLAQAYGLTPPPALVPGCINDMTFVADVTYDDKDMTAPPEVTANQPFVKTWRVQNSGTCAWDTSYRLVYAYGNSDYAQMGGQPTNVPQAVAPGQTVDISVNLIAPPFPGVYQGVWQMEDGRGAPFGQKLYVGISVPGAPPPTPAPTQTPSPGITFSVDRTNIKEGECVTFTWDVENVKEVYFYPDDEPWQENGVPGQGTSKQCPGSTTTYNLRVVKRDGTVETRQITIYVEVTAEAPNIERFTVEPAQVTVGQCTNIRWDVSGDVDTVKILANNRPIWDGAPLSGNMDDCPPGAGVIIYAVEAAGPGGTSRQEANLNVGQPAIPPTATPAPPTATPMPPTATPAPAAPVIQTFTAEPPEIILGECTTLTWQYSGQDLASAVLLANGVPILLDPPPQGTTVHCPGEPGEVIYRLDLAAEFGGRTVKDVRVTVQPQPEAVPY